MAFVGIGVYIAPSHKKICAIVLFGLLSAISGYSCVIHLISKEWLDVLKALLTLAGAGYVLYKAIENQTNGYYV